MFSAYLQELSADDKFMQCYELSAAEAMSGQTGDDFWDSEDPWVAAFRPYVVKNGVLQIPVQGVLLHKFSFQFGRMATGYTYIERAVSRGLADPEVKAIAFVHNSPGGEVAGNFELVDFISANRNEKPMRAFASDHSYSASYNLAAAAGSIIMTRSGGVGSVGVVVAHVEMSEMLKDWGIKVTFIHAGKFKVEGNAYEKLSDHAKQRIQTRVDRIYGEFVAMVAENRGMEESAVRDTEALTYDSSEALDVGFADRVGALEEEMAIFEKEADAQESEFMTAKPNTPAATNDGQITQAQLDAAVAQAKQDGAAEGAKAERDRMSSIMGSEEAKVRPQAAQALADTGMDAETAVATLAKMPEEKAAEPAAPAATTEQPAAPAAAPAAAQPSGFDKAMAGDNPEVGAQLEEPKQQEQATSDQMLAALSAATGKPRKAATH